VFPSCTYFLTQKAVCPQCFKHWFFNLPVDIQTAPVEKFLFFVTGASSSGGSVKNSFHSLVTQRFQVFPLSPSGFLLIRVFVMFRFTKRFTRV
jgi:hypothetical protein